MYNNKTRLTRAQMVERVNDIKAALRGPVNIPPRIQEQLKNELCRLAHRLASIDSSTVVSPMDIPMRSQEEMLLGASELPPGMSIRDAGYLKVSTEENRWMSKSEALEEEDG